MTNYFAQTLGAVLMVGAANSFRTSAPNSHSGWTNSHSSSGNNNNNKRAAFVFLHGMGDDATTGWSSLKDLLPSICPSLDSAMIHYEFPQAPVIGVTLNGGQRVSGWFDIMDWPIDHSIRDDPCGQLKAVKLLEETIDKIEREEGIPASRIVVGGFAQGAAVAMLAAYSRCSRSLEPYAGCVSLSGWLPMRKRFKANPAVSETKSPLFWAHGLYDEKVLIEQQVLGVQKLSDRGISVTACSYPVGHESFDSQEIVQMAQFMDETLFPKVDVESIHNAEVADAEFLASVEYLFDTNERTTNAQKVGSYNHTSAYITR